MEPNLLGLNNITATSASNKISSFISAPAAPAVHRAADRLEEAIDNIAVAMATLEERLIPILRNVPTGQETQAVLDASDDVPHADRLHCNRRMIEGLNERVLGIINRLEV